VARTQLLLPAGRNVSQLEEDRIVRPAFLGVSITEKRTESLFRRAVVLMLFELSMELQQELHGNDTTGLRLDLGKRDVIQGHGHLRKGLEELRIEETR